MFSVLLIFCSRSVVDSLEKKGGTVVWLAGKRGKRKSDFTWFNGNIMFRYLFVLVFVRCFLFGFELKFRLMIIMIIIMGKCCLVGAKREVNS